MKDEAAEFANQAVAALRDAFNAGWGWPAELKEPDFDPLRGRDVFQKLLAELAARTKAKAAKQEAESKCWVGRLDRRLRTREGYAMAEGRTPTAGPHGALPRSCPPRHQSAGL
jgi:hypothetical protein